MTDPSASKPQGRRWRWLTTGKISGAFSSAALAISVWSAVNVYRGEQDRSRVQTAISNSVAYTEYVKFRETDRGRFLACADILRNPIMVPNEELQALAEQQPRHNAAFEYQPQRNFQYNPKRHRALTVCVDDNEIKALLLRGAWNETEKLDEHGTFVPDDARRVRGAIVEKVGPQLAYLDMVLIGYKNDVGDKQLICENFAAYLTAGWINPAYDNQGPFGALLERLIALNIIRDDNYPNLFAFVTKVADATKVPGHPNGFRKPMDCKVFAKKGIIEQITASIRARIWGKSQLDVESKPAKVSEQ